MERKGGREGEGGMAREGEGGRGREGGRGGEGFTLLGISSMVSSLGMCLIGIPDRAEGAAGMAWAD